MATKTKEKKEEYRDEFDDFDDQFSEITLKIPNNVSKESAALLMKQFEKLTADQIRSEKEVSAGRQKYIDESKIRYVCQIDSTRGWPDFEMVLSDPENDSPVILRGLCGEMLEQGLTKYAIDRLKEAHEWHSVPGWSMNASEIMQEESVRVDLYKKKKHRLFSVLVYDEVDNPIPVGVKKGQITKTRNGR